MDNQNAQNQNLYTPPNTNEPAVESPSKKPYRSKKKVVFTCLVLIVVLASSILAYIFFLYLPNKPDNILKKALVSFTQEGSYTVSGRLDEGDANAPDFDYTIKTNGSDFLASIDSSTYMMGPKLDIMKAGGKTYIKSGQWMDKKELAKHYTNLGPKGIQEHLADFAETSGIYTHQDEWIKIDDFVFENTMTGNTKSPKTIEEAGISLVSIGSAEQNNGKKLQNYKLRLSKDGFIKLLNRMSDSAISSNIVSGYLQANGFPDSISIDLQVDTHSKKVHHIKYYGRPLRDATLSLDLTASDNKISAPDSAPLASEILDYGIVKTILFNPDLQNGESKSDRERIADVKGIKMTMEIYKHKHGNYPRRSNMALDSDKLFNEMKGLDRNIFIDPNGKLMNLHGSQYTYIGEAAGGNSTCGGNYYDVVTQKDFKAADCTKFWVATTLDNGQEFKLVSY